MIVFMLVNLIVVDLIKGLFLMLNCNLKEISRISYDKFCGLVFCQSQHYKIAKFCYFETNKLKRLKRSDYAFI